MRTQGFEPVAISTYKPRQSLRVLIGRPKASMGVRGRRAFFFVREQYIGTDAASPSARLRVASQSSSAITLAYTRFAAGDKPCCPSDGTVKVRFSMGDGRLQPLDPIPPAAAACRRPSIKPAMCGRYTLTQVGPRLVDERFELGEAEIEPATLGRFNVCPTEDILVVTHKGPRAVRWGLVPSWSKALGEAPLMINARAETVASKKVFSRLLGRPERRCLVIADGWYEWLRSEKKSEPRVPFHYRVDGGELFAFAGPVRRREDRRRVGPVGHDPHHDRQRRSARRSTTACRSCSPARTRRPPGCRAATSSCSARSRPSAPARRPPTRRSTRPGSRVRSCSS